MYNHSFAQTYALLGNIILVSDIARKPFGTFILYEDNYTSDLFNYSLNFILNIYGIVDCSKVSQMGT